ncbi:serine/threonine-protein kinase [Calothrix sp. NIES-2098]|uniref:serine/threonine-protein kinase n=1 Tax=Calothrix sp. NIES-2098 TaxID=1954171 RepID=UPI000B5FA5A0|nr:serine/threonine protein kinase [Calothrix sp. NIES-2098]
MIQNGTIIRGHYRIQERLGSGGFGITYLAVDIDKPSHSNVVVKQLSLRRNDPENLPLARKLFQREAKVLERLGAKDDRIPELFAYFEENEEFYLVQEFIDGKDLRSEIIPDQPLREEKVIALLQDILKVLEVVHQENVIHRDIKPSNLIRRYSDEKIVLIDFGAVKEISTIEVNANNPPSLTHNVGTPGYTPVEQEQGSPKLSSDIYAVGIVGVQALTGLLPRNLEKDSSGEIIWRKHAPQISNALASVVDKMVCRNYQNRYESATEALTALNKAIEVTSTKPPSQFASYISATQYTSRYPAIANLALCLSLIFNGFYAFQIMQKLFRDRIYQNDNEVAINMRDVCQSNIIYQDIPEIKQIGIINIQKLGPHYEDEFTDVWPVFRWVCLYKIKSKRSGYQFEVPASDRNATKRVGMDLDAYCRWKYPDKDKASHHDYNDHNSLRCVRPHPQ